jgi:hypothetical protein
MRLVSNAGRLTALKSKGDWLKFVLVGLWRPGQGCLLLGERPEFGCLFWVEDKFL